MTLIAAVFLVIGAYLFGPSDVPVPQAEPAAAVAAYFAGLTPVRARELARTYPNVIGNLDGAPIALRYLANQWQDPRYAGRQLLALDESGDGRIVEVLGDLQTATRVVVLVPGVDDTLRNFDTGHGGVLRRAPAWQGRQLYARVGPLTAVVVWLGYDPPEGVRRDAIREERAMAGAVALERFVAGLVVGRPDLRITIVGHSYGSTVAGLAAPALSPQVTDIVAIGSPGMSVDTAADLHSSARIWAGSAPDDWTRRLPGIRLLGAGHGRLPVDPAFGAIPIPCGNVAGHDGYFEPDSVALTAVAAIAGAPRNAGSASPIGSRISAVATSS